MSLISTPSTGSFRVSFSEVTSHFFLSFNSVLPTITCTMSYYIPEEHLRQILKSLPVKSLLRFRCVSQGWKQLIDSPSFLQEHISLQKPTLLIQSPGEYFLADPDTLPSIKRLNSPINLPGYSLLGTHHGVVCLTDFPGLNIILWNPTLRKFSTPIQVPSIVSYRANTTSKGCYGFWIDPSTKEFKILVHHCVSGHFDDSMFVLYSSIRQGWRRFSQPELRDWVNIISVPPLMVNGVAHWTGFHREFQANGVILSFNFVLERFEHIRVPPAPVMHSAITQFLWQGNLAVLHSYGDGSRYEMHARQQGEWVKISAFNLPNINQFTQGVHIIFCVLVQQERLWALAQTCTNILLIETTTGDTSPLVDEFSNAPFPRCTRVANDFVESLLFPSSNTFVMVPW